MPSQKIRLEHWMSIGSDVQCREIKFSYRNLKIPRVLRLDGVYYNTRSDYKSQNQNIKKTHDEASGIIYQSEYGRKLVTSFFGEHLNGRVIYNGADLPKIQVAVPVKNNTEGRNIWSCAASWRPHKRLSENIRYFLEHKGEKDILVIAGDATKIVNDSSIYYAGNITQQSLYSLYKSSKYFLHLGWLDCCPNVVVDARACGCQIICAQSGGTMEVAGKDAIIIEEGEWNFEPLDLYSPPKLDFDKKINNSYDTVYNITEIAKQYVDFMKLNL